MSQADVITQVRQMQEAKEHPMFKVIYLNDNATTVEFVIETLIDFFNYSADSALQVTVNIHEQGSAVVAVLPYEVAEQKGLEVTMTARSNDFPLQIKLEPETV
jgi:ATP-dependent Clp protease adaptor protein ClpS